MKRRIVLAMPMLVACCFGCVVVLVGQCINAPLRHHHEVLRETETKLDKVDEQLETVDKTVEQITLQLNEG